MALAKKPSGEGGGVRCVSTAFVVNLAYEYAIWLNVCRICIAAEGEESHLSEGRGGELGRDQGKVLSLATTKRINRRFFLFFW